MQGLLNQVSASTELLDIPSIKQALKTLSYADRISLCDSLGVHFAYLEAVLNQPGAQQSSFTADVFKQLVERAATRWPALAQQMGVQVPQSAPLWDQLPLTFDEAAPYVAVAIVEAPQPNWLNLPAVHARLLPLARAAGHEKLLLSAHVGTLDEGVYYYEADASGGKAGFRRCISYFDWDSTPEHFERELRKKLEKEAARLAERSQRAA